MQQNARKCEQVRARSGTARKHESTAWCDIYTAASESWRTCARLAIASGRTESVSSAPVRALRQHVVIGSWRGADTSCDAATVAEYHNKYAMIIFLKHKLIFVRVFPRNRCSHDNCMSLLRVSAHCHNITYFEWPARLPQRLIAPLRDNVSVNRSRNGKIFEVENILFSWNSRKHATVYM